MSMKKTLLEIVQDILSDMDSEEVPAILTQYVIPVV